MVSVLVELEKASANTNIEYPVARPRLTEDDSDHIAMVAKKFENMFGMAELSMDEDGNFTDFRAEILGAKLYQIIDFCMSWSRLFPDELRCCIECNGVDIVITTA